MNEEGEGYPNDRFFKETFSRVEVARDFVRNYVPSEISALLDSGTFKISKDTFVNETLSERFSDLLYSAEIKGKGKIFVYFLFEHKSYQDPEVALYLLLLMVRIWISYRKQGKKGLLPPILPLVVYHGKKKWRVKPSFQDMIGLTDVMGPYIPNFEYLIWDLSRHSDGELKGGVLLRVTFLLMKHIFSEDLGKMLPGYLGLLEQLDDRRTALQFLEASLRYLSSGSSHVSREELVNALKEIRLDQGGELMATLAEEWIEQGMLKEAREMVQEAISSRFGSVPDDIACELVGFKDRERLRKLLRQAVVCRDLGVFRNALKESMV